MAPSGQSVSSQILFSHRFSICLSPWRQWITRTSFPKTRVEIPNVIEASLHTYSHMHMYKLRQYQELIQNNNSKGFSLLF
jgi:hypothetical protein